MPNPKIRGFVRGPHYDNPDNVLVRTVALLHGLSYYRMAALLGVAKRAVPQWADGTNRVSPFALQRVRRLATALTAAGETGKGIRCVWSRQRWRKTGAWPTPWEVAEHLDGCVVCMRKAYAALIPKD